MTEDEAKNMACPELLDPLFRHGRYVETFKGKCIGSECMAWRWGLEVRGVRGDHGGVPVSPPVDGWCGLAGKP